MRIALPGMVLVLLLPEAIGPQVVKYTLWSFLLVLGTWSVHPREIKLPRTWFLLTLSMVVLGLAWAFFAPFPAFHLMRIATLVLVFIAAALFMTLSAHGRSQLHRSWLIVVSVTVLWAALQWISAGHLAYITHQESYLVKASFGHRNLLAHFLSLAVILPWTVPLSNPTAARWRWIVSLGALAVSMILLSRGAWLINGLVLAALFLLAPATEGLKALKRRTIALVALAVVALIVITLDEWRTLSHHFETMVDTQEGTTRDRLLLVKNSWTMALSSPWMGVGGGSWPVEIMAFDQSGMATSNGDFQYLRPHNDYLWLAAEYGLVVAGFYFLVHGLCLVTAARHYWRSRSAQGLALALSWLAFMVISATNYALERMEFNVVQAWLMALTFTQGTPVRTIAIPSRLFRVSVLAVFGFLLLVTLSRTPLAGSFRVWTTPYDEHVLPVEYHLGQLFHASGHTEEAAVLLQSALERVPEHPQIWYALGTTMDASGNAWAAESAYRRAIASAPTHPHAWLSLAARAYDKCAIDEAWVCLRRADPRTDDLRFTPYAVLLGNDSLEQYVDDWPERRIRLTMEAIQNTPEWTAGVVRSSLINGFSFRRQLLIDGFYYMMKDCDSPEACSETQALKEKYLPGVDLHLSEN